MGEGQTNIKRVPVNGESHAYINHDKKLTREIIEYMIGSYKVRESVVYRILFQGLMDEVIDEVIFEGFHYDEGGSIVFNFKRTVDDFGIPCILQRTSQGYTTVYYDINEPRYSIKNRMKAIGCEITWRVEWTK